MHYEIPLPFREGNVQLPNNRSQAVQCLHGLKKRLKVTCSIMPSTYFSVISEIIEKGYARKVSAKELSPEEGKVWYLSHHRVYHPKKPGSLRVLFDCSAQELNDHLLQGSDLSSKITGVLTRFRKERVAFMADKEKMFFQVTVKKENQNFFRFMWRSNGHLTQEPQENCMTVHLFDAGSSPGYSKFAVKCTAEDGEREFSARTAEALKKNFKR